MSEVSLPSFEKFYYDYKSLILDIETVIGIKCSKMKSENYNPNKEKIYNKVSLFAQKYDQSNYYRYLLQDLMERYLEGDGVTNAKNCLNENLVYGSLSAYRLFYVGCSRARKNLTIIIDKTKVAEFEEKLIEKFKWCGFKVV